MAGMTADRAQRNTDDNMPCKVSVLCTTYNHKDFLRETLDGFLAQKTDFFYEVLVNDDASTDGTAEILRDYAEKYPEVISPFYQKENLYSKDVCIEYEILLPFARGEYIAFCEGDDYWTDPEKLQRQVDFLDAYPDYSACVHNSMGHRSGTNSPDELLFASVGDRDLDFAQVAKGMHVSFHTSSMLMRREFVENPPEFLLKSQAYGFTDYPQALWLAHNGKIRFLDRPMSVYRIGSNPDAWSSNQAKFYARRKQFIAGEIAMFEGLMPWLSETEKQAAERELHARRFEYYYITGQAEQLLEPEYADLLREKSLAFQLSTRLKKVFPVLHRLYRKKKGYGD